MRRRLTRILTGLGLLWSSGLMAVVGLAEQQTASQSATATMSPPTATPPVGPVGTSLGPWATAAFVWVILFLAIVFVIAMGWISRSRRS